MWWLGPKFEELPDYKRKYARAKSWVHYNKQIYNLKSSKYSWHSIKNIWRQVVNWVDCQTYSVMENAFSSVYGLYLQSHLTLFVLKPWWICKLTREKKGGCKRYKAWLWHGNKAQEFFCMKRAIQGYIFSWLHLGEGKMEWQSWLSSWQRWQLMLMDGCEEGGIAAMSWIFVCCMCGVCLHDLQLKLTLDKQLSALLQTQKKFQLNLTLL